MSPGQNLHTEGERREPSSFLCSNPVIYILQPMRNLSTNRVAE
jgi:hypothetical protein